MSFKSAVLEVFQDPEIHKKYPNGMNSVDILHEIRQKYGQDAFPYCTVIDVADQMRETYG